MLKSDLKRKKNISKSKSIAKIRKNKGYYQSAPRKIEKRLLIIQN